LLVIRFDLILEYATIYLFSPLAIKQNRTTTFSVSTSFLGNIEYGPEIEYFCGYGANKTTEESIATVSHGRFSCSVHLLNEGKALLDISMKVKGIMKKLTNAEQFNVVSKEFSFNSRL
jgi:hypothetical protein